MCTSPADGDTRPTVVKSTSVNTCGWKGNVLVLLTVAISVQSPHEFNIVIMIMIIISVLLLIKTPLSFEMTVHQFSCKCVYFWYNSYLYSFIFYAISHYSYSVQYFLMLYSFCLRAAVIPAFYPTRINKGIFDLLGVTLSQSTYRTWQMEMFHWS